MRYIRVSELKEAINQLNDDDILIVNQCSNLSVNDAACEYYGYIKFKNSELTPIEIGYLEPCFYPVWKPEHETI